MKTLLASCALLCAALPAQNQALSFTNGSVDTHFDIAYAPGLLPRRSITVEAWITYDDASLAVGQGFRWPTIARQDVAPGGESWFLRIGGGEQWCPQPRVGLPQRFVPAVHDLPVHAR